MKWKIFIRIFIVTFFIILIIPLSQAEFTARTEQSAQAASCTGACDFTVNKATGTVDGDIMFMFLSIYIATPATVDSVPADWTLVATNATSNTRWYLYYKIASNEGDSYTWSLSKSTRYLAVNTAYSSGNFDVQSLNDITVSNALYGTAGTAVQAASMNVPNANSPLVFFGNIYSTTARSFTKPYVPNTDWVEDFDYGHNTPDLTSTIDSMIWTDSGSTGNMFANCSVSITTEKNAFAVALKPDTTYPIINITYPINNSNLSSATFNLNYTFVEANPGFCWYSNNSGVANSSAVAMGTNWTLTGVEEVNNRTVYCNDTGGNTNSSFVRFTIDTTPPNINITSPINETNTSDTGIDVKYTRGSDVQACWYSNDTYSANTTLTNCVNITTVTWIEGQHNVTIWANDSAGNTNSSFVRFTIDTKAPSVTSLTETPSDFPDYSLGATYEFNATITDPVGISTVILEFNGINYTTSNAGSVYNVTLINLPAGGFNYSWFANDTLGNANNTEKGNYTINQTTGEINGTINGTQGNFSAINGTANQNIYINATNITGIGAGKIYVNGTLYNSGTLPLYNITNLSAGFYNITFEYDGNENYTSDSEVWWVNITQKLDTCSCPGNGNNWEIKLSDYCIIDNDCNLGVGTLNFTGSGNVTCSANINTTNLGDTGTNGIMYIKSDCYILIS